MLHPLLSVVVARPDLVAEHAAGYAALVREEGAQLASHWVRRATACVVALLSIAVTWVLAGTAVMLAAVNGIFHWSLVVMPAIALVPALWAWGTLRQTMLSDDAFPAVADQFQADLNALRAAGDKRHAR